jgi:hypothetical protein
MEGIETRSTSLHTAVCKPIVLRQTDRIRLVFLPMLVDNPAVRGACVKGHFVYQRKAEKDDWCQLGSSSLASLKSGEGFKLELHSQELLTLVREVNPLYRIYRQYGIPRGRGIFVRLEASLARFFQLGEEELTSFLESHSHDAARTLFKLLRWLTASRQGSDAAVKLAGMNPEQLPGLTALLGLIAVKDALRLWKQNETNGSEEFWQKALSDRAYVLSQVFAYPIVVICSKAYVGGKQITNTGGNVVDFLASVESTDAVVLIEIKTPVTKLVGSEYRNRIFPLSVELTGAIAQVLTYRQSLMRDFDSLMRERSVRATLGEPRCLVVAGHAGKQLADGDLRESFELQRERLHGVTVVTYDELFHKIERLVTLIEGEGAQADSEVPDDGAW